MLTLSNKSAHAAYPITFEIVTQKEGLMAFGTHESDKQRLDLQLGKSKNKAFRLAQNSQEVLVAYASQTENANDQAEQLRRLGAKGLQWINEGQYNAVIIKGGTAWQQLQLAEGLALANYQFLKYFTDAPQRQNSLSHICVMDATDADIQWLQVVVNAVFEARNLINEPVITLTATQLGEEAKRLGQIHGFKTEVLNMQKIQALKMGGLLAVNSGSQEPPTFTIMEYKGAGAKNEQPIVLVGKGVVYDTGGLSLKPTAGSMDSMKSDMSGAAATIATLSAIAAAKLPVYVVGLVPATDNRPGENAYTPGDVITMGSGKKVEVLNTDAEGRMILADALHFAKKYNPQLVIDLATLTGAAAVAIGKYGVVAMGTASDEVFGALQKSGEAVHERLARFPFWEEYDELIKSNIADIKNIGGREGGAITAGKFLAHFIDYPWIHLDIAGPAFLEADDHYRLRGGTGVGVRLLTHFLKQMA